MNLSIEKLVFVYNAHSGILNMALDAAHKVFSPKTYPCKLCELTYGAVSERNVWKSFRKANNTPFEFLHIDEFEEQFTGYIPETVTYPIVFSWSGNLLTEFISAQEMNGLTSVDELIALVEERIA